MNYFQNSDELLYYCSAKAWKTNMIFRKLFANARPLKQSYWLIFPFFSLLPKSFSTDICLFLSEEFDTIATRLCKILNY